MNKKKRSIFKKIGLLLSLVLIFAVTSQSTLAYYVTKSETVVNTFKPIEKIVYNLLLTKTVEHPFGEVYVIPENIGFWYEVDLGETYANRELSITKGVEQKETVLTDENGVFEVWMDPGVSVYVQGIAEGTAVTVTELTDEQNMLSGFAPKDGISSKEVTIAADGGAVDFVNVYTPDSVMAFDLNVWGKKEMDGREWRTGDSFGFLLDVKDKAGNWMNVGEANIEYDAVYGEESKAFYFIESLEEYEFAEAGTYSFRVTEEAGTEVGMEYDDAEKTFQVVVGDADMDGRLEIQDVVAGTGITVTKDAKTGVYNISMKFLNTYTEPVEPSDPGVSPPTGDDSQMPLAALLTIVCAAAVLLASAGRRKLLYR
ncbi:MAG: hypothetical protein IJ471_07205 [Eubacterium sp.]|nr:hypothetical protein [Eubacterium sp.]